MDEPLAPLPDEPVQDDEDDDEKEQDDGADSQVPTASRDASELPTAHQSVAPEESKPHPLSMSLVPSELQSADDAVDEDGALDTSLNPTLNVPDPLGGVNVGEQLDAGIGGIDIRQFEAAVEGFDPNAVEDQVMQDALQNGMPMLGK